MGQQVSIPLIVSLIGLIALTGFQLQNQGETQAAKSMAASSTERPISLDPSSHSPLPQFALAPLEAFSETLARPLFYEARQPPELSATESGDSLAQSESIATEDLILSGIVLSGEEEFILVQDRGRESLTRIEKGQDVGGWSLDAIRDDSVLLRKDNQTKVVPLWRFQPPPKQAAKARSRDAAKQTAQQRRRQNQR